MAAKKPKKLPRLTFPRGPLALGNAVQAHGAGKLRLLMVVYHKGHRATVRAVETGFQPTPWNCSKCGERCEADDLRYAWATAPSGRSEP
jgi:hypothetical protein